MADESSPRLAWPDIDIPEELFDRYLAERAAGNEVINAADLYLACGCVHQVPQALEAFERQYMSRVPELVARMSLSRAAVDDLCQYLRERLLLASSGRPPHLAEYSGRGTLMGWLRVVATRAAVDMIRSSKPHDEELDSHEKLMGGEVDPELGYLKQRYQSEFKEALAVGLRSLSAQHRNVLRLYFVDQLTLVEIGALYRVGKSTIFRWIGSAREQLLTEARRCLHDRLGLSPEEFDSLANAVRSELDLSLPALLQTHSKIQ
jgi:RNA polymerase sigma-70 factor (ECF subfamily)